MDKDREHDRVCMIWGMKKKDREIKRDDPLTVDARKETEEGRGADREKWHIRRIRESIQRADSVLLDRISPAMPGRPPLL